MSSSALLLEYSSLDSSSVSILTTSKSSALGISPRSIGSVLSSCLVLAKTIASYSNSVLSLFSFARESSTS